jgi:hypothetical protein
MTPWLGALILALGLVAAGPAAAQQTISQPLPQGWEPRLERFLERFGVRDAREAARAARSLRLSTNRPAEEGVLIRIEHPETCQGQRCLVIDALAPGGGDIQASLMVYAGSRVLPLERCPTRIACDGAILMAEDGATTIIFLTPLGFVVY